MTAKVILNPYAGRWLAQKRRSEAENALHAAGIEFEIVATSQPGEGENLAFQAVIDGFSPIISAGGDGSISEVLNGMMRAKEQGAQIPPLGIIPLGSANDLVCNLGLPLDLIAAAKVISLNQPKLMDVCKVNDRYFGNNAAIGLEPYITLIQQKIQKVKGSLRYIYATLIGVKDNPSWTMQLTWDDGSYQGPITLVTVGNNPRTGGVFYVTPHANPMDGKITFVYGYISTRRKILTVLPKIMKPDKGNYVEHPDIHEIHATYLKVISEQPTPMHADGEIQSKAIKEIEFRVLPASITVLTQPN